MVAVNKNVYLARVVAETSNALWGSIYAGEDGRESLESNLKAYLDAVQAAISQALVPFDAQRGELLQHVLESRAALAQALAKDLAGSVRDAYTHDYVQACLALTGYLLNKPPEVTGAEAQDGI